MSDTESGGLWGFVTENFRDLAVLALLGAVYFHVTDATPPELPEWTSLAVLCGVLVLIGALFASGKIEDLIPDEEGIHLVVVNESDGQPIEHWELTEDDWADLTVVNPPLVHHEGAKHRAYECYAFNPDDLTAVSTWKRSLAGSDVVGHHTADDAMDAIEEIRQDLAPEARYGSKLKRQLPSVIRRLDRRRAMEQDRALDPHLTPSIGEEQTIDELLAEELPDDVLPDRLAQDDADDLAGRPDRDDDGAVFEFLDGAEDDALDPIGPDATNGHTNGHGGGD